MIYLWVVFFVALTGSHLGDGLPIGTTPQTYPHDHLGAHDAFHESWWSDQRLYTAVPALALLITAGLLFGCMWCYRHKDSKVFSTSAVHLHNERRPPPTAPGFPEPANNNVSEANNNGPISFREMQNIVNNNAGAYIVSENEERNRTVSRESVVQFEPLPEQLGAAADPLLRCADWFGADDFPRDRLQYLREIGRGWFGRVVEGEMEGEHSSLAVKILNPQASLEDKARFLDEAKMYRDLRHDHLLAYVARCLQDDPWILLFELYSMDLQQYLAVNRPKMASLNEAGAPLRLQCDVTSALAYLHAHGYVYGNLWSGNVLVRGDGEAARAVLGRYTDAPAPAPAPQPINIHTTSTEVWSLGALLWEVCSWEAPGAPPPLPEPALPCPYRAHLYQVMQLCWSAPAARPAASQVHSLLAHLLTSQRSPAAAADEFEARWQRLKPNSIPKLDEHVVIVHAPSTSARDHFTGSEHELDTSGTMPESPSAELSRCSSAHAHAQGSLTNLHGSLDDVRVQHDPSDPHDQPLDTWLKDIVAGSQDDVSYYRDVSDVIKNLDNILNSEKTSSSESSHQASPSRDNLSLDCNREPPPQSSLVKSPGISNFQNLLDGYDQEDIEEEVDRDTAGTLSHSYERHSDAFSQHTLAELTPDTPLKDTTYHVSDLEKRMQPIGEATDVVGNNEAICEEPIGKTTDVVGNNEAICEDPIGETTDVVGNNEAICEEPIGKTTDVVGNNESVCEDPIGETTDVVGNKEAVCEDPIGEVTDVVGNNEAICEDPIVEATHELVTNNKVVSEMPAEVAISSKDVPKLKELCIDRPRISEVKEQLSERTDTHKSIEQIINHHPEFVTRVIEIPQKSIKDCENFLNNELEHCQSEKTIASEEICKTLDVVLDLAPILNANTDSQHEVSSLSDCINGDNKLVEQSQGSFENLEDEYVLFEDKHESGEDALVDAVNEHTHSHNSHDLSSAVDLIPHSLESNDIPPEELKDCSESLETHSMDTQSTLPLETPDVMVQTQPSINKEEICTKLEDITQDMQSDDVLQNTEMSVHAVCDESTVYMDLINDTNSENVNKINYLVDNSMREMPSSVIPSTDTTECEPQNESTVYMDLPNVITETHKLLHAERFVSSEEVVDDAFKSDIPGSTPKSNDPDSTVVREANTPDYGPGVTLTRLEQKFVPDCLSPFESPTKSHPTDTYDENSSVVLGPFENCNELFKGLKSAAGYAEIDVPKEELLAFSSNFSDIYLETPSPLRDGNFLNEVPDIEVVLHFDDIDTISDPDTLENTEVSAPTNHYTGPSTPPNSPGAFLASTSKYLVEDIPPPPEPHCSSREIDLSQIELQMTSKLAMAENENNMNIEYSGPLTLEGLVTDSSQMLLEKDSMSEAVLAGNGVSEMGGSVVFDEASMAALRNELELKLPLAQVASIEPSDELAWEPPELVVNYPGALSPIMEETGHQLSAYENDRLWITSARTDSSESYLEPCNNSTDEVTDLPTATATAAASGAPPHTYTVNSARSDADADTYTIQRDITTSRDITMSADSLNGSPAKIAKSNSMSPTNDRTYIKDDEKESRCERISQESPFLVSPTTETSVPVNTDGGVSTLSKTSVPTDAKASKPSETQCLSKATSIDSWCSNDTLFNVEDNFDDLAIEAEADTDNEDHSHSTDTLTHHDDDKDKDDSHCLTYIVHDSNSEIETFTPDSTTGNCTYTKIRADAEKTPEAITDHNDSSTKNTTKDLAYGTMASGYTFSNCTTELLTTNEDAWKSAQPELVRRSPVPDLINITPPHGETKEDLQLQESPQLNVAKIKKMESVELTCLEDNLMDSNDERLSETQNLSPNNVDDNRDFHYRNMTNSMHSTPLEPLYENDTTVTVTSPLQLPNVDESPKSFNVPNYYEAFVNSAELRQQDSQVSGLLLEAASRTLSLPSQISEELTPTYSDFEMSAAAQPQEICLKSTSQEFQDFRNSVRSRPQDISGIQNICSMLIQSERSYDMSSTNDCFDHTFPSALNERLNQTNNNTYVIISPVETTDLHTPIASVNFSLEVPRIIEPDMSVEDDEQPHSIIITESPCIKQSAYLTYDSQTETESKGFNDAYVVHPHQDQNNDRKPQHSMDESGSPRINGEVLDETVKNMALSAIGQQIIEIPLDQQMVKETTQAVTKTATNEVTPDLLNGPVVLETELQHRPINEVQCNGSGAKYATVNFINESFEELIENVDTDKRKTETELDNESSQKQTVVHNVEVNGDDQTEVSSTDTIQTNGEAHQSEVNRDNGQDEGVTSVTETFLQNEKQFCEFDRYLPLMNDIRFTGPTSEIMSTSFSIESPTEPSPPSEVSRSEPNGHSGNSGRDVTADMKEWDSDSDDSQSSNPSSGEFIWKDGGGNETCVVPSTYFDHQRGGQAPRPPPPPSDGASDAGSGSGSGSDAGSGSEGDEVEFVPSSWDSRAAPAKSSLRLAEQASPLNNEGKKRVVFKRQKYHCVYEYPRELADVDCEALSAHVDQLPDYSTYSDWATASNEEAELSYGQLYGGHPFDMSYPLRAGVSFGSDYDEDFFISSSAHPFESLGVMSTSSQFFPGMRLQALKCPPPNPPAPPPPPPTQPDLGFTTPDSGVEDVITPGELVEEEFAKKQETEASQATCWRGPDSASSSESVSPSSPGAGGALGGLRHTRDKLKLDLPPSPCVPSPRHSRVFNFVLDKPPPPRRAPDAPAPLVMSDETPLCASALPVCEVDDVPLPEPTFSTFGKSQRAVEAERGPQVCAEPAPECAAAATAGSAPDEASGDEDSGIESSAQATLERDKEAPATPAPAPAPTPHHA